MKVAVVIPSYRTPAYQLERCLKSVAEQTHGCTPFLVCDGDFPPVYLPASVQVLRLPAPHGDFGNAARAIGSVAAICEGFEAIAYLDADNWYEPGHIEWLVADHERTAAPVCTTGRNLFDKDGQFLGQCTEVNGETFVDTSCLFFTRAAFDLLAVWYRMPLALAPVGDRVVWRAVLRSGLPRHHSGRATVNYTTSYACHFFQIGQIPPIGSKKNSAIQADAKVIAEWLG